MTRMLVVGGTGETGSWFARYFKAKGFDVAIWGPSGRVAIAEKLGVHYAFDIMEEVKESDIVLLSVPINKTSEAAKQIAPHMKSGSLIMDVTSLKTDPLRAMKMYAPKGVEVLGMHPLFGPTMPNLQGQTIILTPAARKTKKWFPIIRALFESDGARIEVISAEKHDEIMAVVQALTHFAYIGIGATLRALEFDVELSRKFMSPVYEIMIDFVGRILDQNPDLYASIQENPKALRVRQTFILECMRLCEMADAKDHEGFKKAMKGAAKHYGKTCEAFVRSDRLIIDRIRDREL